MEAAATRAERYACAHCGLPVTDVQDAALPEEIFCCHACRVVALIIGKQEQGDLSWNLLRLGFGGLLAMNIMMISLLLYTGSIETDTIPVFRRVLLLLATPALVILLPPFLAGAVRETSTGRLSLDTLIAGGSLSAFLVSAANTVRGAGEVYFDTATMLPVLVTVGKIIEASAKSRAASLLTSLESLLPPNALKLTDTGTEEVPIGELAPGDTIRVRPGERIAVDGKVVEGTSRIEEAAFSGEFLPRLCGPGDTVVAGTVNGTNSLLVLAERTGRDILLHGILDMIHDGWRRTSRAERLAERAAAIFIPAVLALALGAIFCWSLLGDAVQGLLSALSVLVVACPCTMGIATPLATSLAIARAAKAGIVVRGGRVMERMAGTEMMFFDKTGTLTAGSPVIHEIMAAPGEHETELLGRLATLELASEHPLGQAVIEKAREFNIEEGSASDVTSFPGSGITGDVTWQGVTKRVAAGTDAFIAGACSTALEEKRTCISVAWDGTVRGRLLLTDDVRPEAAATIAGLARKGIAALLLSGDTFSAAAGVARSAGIPEFYAARSPSEKVEMINSAVAAGRTVAMVGDGVNDAPALAAAHIGIAVGGGMDLAKQAGNVVMVSGSLAQIPWLISLSRETVKVVRENFVWSFGYNLIALTAAAAGMLHPLIAALLMVVSSVTVLGNSLRLAGFPDEVANDGTKGDSDGAKATC